MVNNIVLVGRIANGLEIKNTKNGNVANISVAVQSKRKKSEGIYKTNFFDCELWGKKAEKTVDYFKIGDIVSVTGEVDISSYEKDGEKRKTIKIIPDDFSLVSPVREKEINKQQNDFDKDIEM